MESNVANNTPNGNGAFPRIVIYSTVAPTRPSARAAFHRESPIAGYPDCGTTLIRPHRAISVDDTRLCGHCWGDIAEVGSRKLSTGVETIGTAPVDAPTSHRGLTKSTPAPTKTRGI